MAEIRPALCLRLPRLRKQKVISEHRPLVWAAQKEHDRLNLSSQAAPAQSRLNMTHCSPKGWFLLVFLGGPFFPAVSFLCPGLSRGLLLSVVVRWSSCLSCWLLAFLQFCSLLCLRVGRSSFLGFGVLFSAFSLASWRVSLSCKTRGGVYASEYATVHFRMHLSA